MNLANSLTVLRIILTPFFVYYFLQDDSESLLISISIFIVASFTDWFDGYYARRTNSITRFGQFMDPLADKILNLSATYLFLLKGYLFGWVFFLIFFRDLYTTLLRMYALIKNQPVLTSRVAQWKTFIHMGLLAVIFTQIVLTELFDLKLIDLTADYISITGVAWLSTAILSLYTSIDYSIDNRNHIIQLWRSFLKMIKLI